MNGRQHGDDLMANADGSSRDGHFGGLIGFSGSRGAGKTFASSILSRTGYWTVDSFSADCRSIFQELLHAIGYSHDVQKSILSGALRDAVCPAIGQTSDAFLSLLYDHLDSNGHIAESLGYSDLWVGRMMDRINLSRRAGRNVVIDDMNTVQQARIVGRSGGMRVWIDRPPVSRMSDGDSYGDERIAMMEKMYAEPPGPRWYVGNRRSVLFDVISGFVLRSARPISASDQDVIRETILNFVDSLVIPSISGHSCAPLKNKAQRSASERNADIIIRNGGTPADLARSIEDVIASTDLHMIAAAKQEV